MMHAAILERSERLKRVRALLVDGSWHSTRDIVHGADVMAVSACIAELRANGLDIACRQRPDPEWPGRRVWEYRLVTPAEAAT